MSTINLEAKYAQSHRKINKRQDAEGQAKSWRRKIAKGKVNTRGEWWKNVGAVLAIKVETAKLDPEPDEQVAESMASTLKEQVA